MAKRTPQEEMHAFLTGRNPANSVFTTISLSDLAHGGSRRVVLPGIVLSALAWSLLALMTAPGAKFELEEKVDVDQQSRDRRLIFLRSAEATVIRLLRGFDLGITQRHDASGERHRREENDVEDLPPQVERRVDGAEAAARLVLGRDRGIVDQGMQFAVLEPLLDLGDRGERAGRIG